MTTPLHAGRRTARRPDPGCVAGSIANRVVGDGRLPPARAARNVERVQHLPCGRDAPRVDDFGFVVPHDQVLVAVRVVGDRRGVLVAVQLGDREEGDGIRERGTHSQHRDQRNQRNDRCRRRSCHTRENANRTPTRHHGSPRRRAATREQNACQDSGSVCRLRAEEAVAGRDGGLSCMGPSIAAPDAVSTEIPESMRARELPRILRAPLIASARASISGGQRRIAIPL